MAKEPPTKNIAVAFSATPAAQMALDDACGEVAEITGIKCRKAGLVEAAVMQYIKTRHNAIFQKYKLGGDSE